MEMNDKCGALHVVFTPLTAVYHQHHKVLYATFCNGLWYKTLQLVFLLTRKY